jgi:predicted nucleic acid-binding protein
VVAANDPNHRAAAAAFEDLLSAPLVTHNYVVVESIALVHSRFGHAAAGSRAPVSFVDRVSFELMRRERIDAAFRIRSGLRPRGLSS